MRINWKRLCWTTAQKLHTLEKGTITRDQLQIAIRDLRLQLEAQFVSRTKDTDDPEIQGEEGEQTSDDTKGI